MTLKQIFISLLNQYTTETLVIEKLWAEIERAYTHQKRYYHSLTHLGNLLNELEVVKHEIQDWNSVLFALYYHDIVYNTLKSNNEEKSAELGEKRMLELGINLKLLEGTKEIILATKSHSTSKIHDVNLFTDADLSVLGYDWIEYEIYFKQIRKEYSIYPDILYTPGRKKVLMHFLAMNRIYKTDYFYQKYEMIARDNLKKELEFIS
jgi:predicted metal-dependent HD superfamily phosphohydrolase